MGLFGNDPSQAIRLDSITRERQQLFRGAATQSVKRFWTSQPKGDATYGLSKQLKFCEFLDKRASGNSRFKDFFKETVLSLATEGPDFVDAGDFDVKFANAWKFRNAGVVDVASAFSFRTKYGTGLGLIVDLPLRNAEAYPLVMTLGDDEDWLVGYATRVDLETHGKEIVNHAGRPALWMSPWDLRLAGDFIARY